MRRGGVCGQREEQKTSMSLKIDVSCHHIHEAIMAETLEIIILVRLRIALDVTNDKYIALLAHSSNSFQQPRDSS